MHPEPNTSSNHGRGQPSHSQHGRLDGRGKESLQHALMLGAPRVGVAGDGVAREGAELFPAEPVLQLDDGEAVGRHISLDRLDILDVVLPQMLLASFLAREETAAEELVGHDVHLVHVVHGAVEVLEEVHGEAAQGGHGEAHKVVEGPYPLVGIALRQQEADVRVRQVGVEALRERVAP